MREQRLRRRAGAAYARLQAQAVELAAALGVHHTTIVHRRAGQGGLANVAIEVDAWERAGCDTMPLLAALLEVRAAARAERGGVSCLDTLSQQEQALDGAENEGQIHYHTTGCARRWLDALTTYVAHAKAEVIPALTAHVRGDR